MSDALTTVTDAATSDFAKDLGKTLATSAAISVAQVAGGILVLAVAGHAHSMYVNRKNKKNTLVVVPE